MSNAADLAAIDAAILDWRIEHLAASARAQTGQLAPYDHEVRSSDPYVAALQQRGMVRSAAPVDAAVPRRGWSRRQVGVAVAVFAAAAALVVWAVVGVVNAASNALAGSGGSLGGLIMLAGLAVLAGLLCRGRGGRSFSGTFTGRMH